jgi:hypothetical protein
MCKGKLQCTCLNQVSLLILSVDGRTMATVEGKKKRKRRAGLASQEYKSHDWWIEGERGPSAPPKQCAQLYIRKEPIHLHMGTGLEVNKGRVVSISIGISGQEHFFITTNDGVKEGNFTLLSSNMLRPVSRKSKAQDVLKNLDIVATCWSQVPPYEQRMQEVMSKREQQTRVDEHGSVERLYAKWRVTPHKSNTSPM